LANKQRYRIKAVRNALRIQQKELAKKAGISQPFLHDLENNLRGAKPETLERIAEGLGVNVSLLVEKDVS
jgi:transcriptional regulator with XRE-family HTH domain